MNIPRARPEHASPPSFGSPPPHSMSLSSAGSSPTLAFRPSSSTTKTLKPFNKQDIKVLLLENVNQSGIEILRGQGYQVECLKTSLPEDELIDKIKDVDVIGIRSKTKLTERVLKSAKQLTVVGCFCIGTNQVDTKTAAQLGIAVFNSPFSNSRSVAELTMFQIIGLARQATDRITEMVRDGRWNKVSSRCWQVLGKTLGIVGYGHVGSQLSVLAQSMGLNVIYYDILPLMAMGTARQVESLDELLDQSDFVTLHVPELPATKNLIGAPQLAKMRQGSYLINNSRGSVVDVPALVDAMRTGKIAGAAMDVYPNEPGGNGDYFTSGLGSWVDDLRGLKNIMPTPHVGGSTEEAQSAIGVEVGTALVRYVNEGSTVGSVNMPQLALKTMAKSDLVRIILIHRNVAGVLGRVMSMLQSHNIEDQASSSGGGEVAYLMADISNVNHGELKDLLASLEEVPAAIRTRILY